jgi:hypothetical protein
MDINTVELRARVDVESPSQSVTFPAPGRHDDAYYVSLTTITRVTFDQ